MHPTDSVEANALLGMPAAAFLRRLWHRHAHLVRQAIPGFSGFLDRAAMFRLALRDDVESRLVRRDGRRWELHHGPFRRKDLAALPERNWTLLIQGVNLHLPEGAELIRRFDFVSHARLDDLMVSYAVPGGGVGPHFDSYDVFLLQGPGRRRWCISAQDDLELRPNFPLKILRKFHTEARWTLEAGDMLYLPPRYAHDGVAIDECLTYSIGFRAPAFQEFAQEFLMRLSEHLDLPGRYADPSPGVTRTPGRIPVRLVDATQGALKRIRWNLRDVEECLGCYLTDPKPSVFFSPRESPLPRASLARRMRDEDIRLHRKSQMLYSSRAVFLNGEVYRFPRNLPAWLCTLSDRRHVRIGAPSSTDVDLVREWHASGFVALSNDTEDREDG